jgi:hypothetical protein
MPENTSKLLELAAEMRACAEEALARAEVSQDADVREMMRRVAASYERLAQHLEKQAGDR